MQLDSYLYFKKYFNKKINLFKLRVKNNFSLMPQSSGRIAAKTLTNGCYCIGIGSIIKHF